MICTSGADGGATGCGGGGGGAGAGGGGVKPPPGTHAEADADGFHSPAEGFMLIRLMSTPELCDCGRQELGMKFAAVGRRMLNK